MSFSLKGGMTVERFWDNGARQFYVPAGSHTQEEWPFLPSGRFYRVTEDSHGGNWQKHDPNYARAKAYLASVPPDAGYQEEIRGGRTIGQAVADVRSPFILADGTLTATLDGGAEIAIRTLAQKRATPLSPTIGRRGSASPR